MSTSPSDRDESPTPPEKSTVILLLKDIGNITWRMFAPMIAGILIGLFVDTKLQSGPWGVITGIIVGLALTALLIRDIYKKL